MATALRNLSAADAARDALEAYLAAAERKSLLRFITCGSVDDGKSTLIGRLLYDSKLLFEDQLAELETSGGQGEVLDFASLVDGLAAEREQGITIDVAYRFFATDKRKFIVADTPGHEQYTRNMVTGASTADAAVILIDARKGVLTQTRRHSTIVHLLGIRHLVLAINKMDLVGYDQARFDAIVAEFRAFAGQAGIADFTAIPVSGLAGDNVTAPSAAMPWYRGPTLIEHLETVPTGTSESAAEPFRMAVQWVNRPNQDFRGFAGRIASGRARVGDRVVILPAGRTSRIARITTFDGDLHEAAAGQSVTLTLIDEVDCSRGDVIAAAAAPPELATRLAATLIWMSPEAMAPHRSFWLKTGTRTLTARPVRIGPVIDVDSIEERPALSLGLNDIALVELELDRPHPAVRYRDNRRLGGFILIDKLTDMTVAAGLVRDFTADAPRPQDRWTGRIRLVSGPGAEEAAWAAAERLRSLGRPASLLDRASLAGLLALAPGRSVEIAREMADLMSRAGVEVLVTVPVPQDAQFPGRRVSADELQAEGGAEWVI